MFSSIPNHLAKPFVNRVLPAHKSHFSKIILWSFAIFFHNSNISSGVFIINSIFFSIVKKMIVCLNNILFIAFNSIKDRFKFIKLKS